MAKPDLTSGVGLVETKQARLELPGDGYRLRAGGVLSEIIVAYETYGALTAGRDNAIFICHALTGDAHAAGYHRAEDKHPGWWDQMIGPGRAIDTNFYHVICANILGGCKGTTGPASLNPATGLPYGASFPRICVADIVDVHKRFVEQLGIGELAAVIGGSFGGMQVLDWAIRYPSTVRRCICIASAKSLSAQALAFDIVARHAITGDPDWQSGDYYATGKKPGRGLALAREIGHITYLSPGMMSAKFGRERRSGPSSSVGSDAGAGSGASGASRFGSNFQVESYLNHQGMRLVERFDANSYLHITAAMDDFDLAEEYGSLSRALEPIRSKMLIVALSSDWLFPPEQSMELANALLSAGKAVSYCELQAPHGHDAFLLDIEHLSDLIQAFLPWVRTGEWTSQRSVPHVCERRQAEFDALVGLLAEGSRVLDLGCGDGELLTVLAARRGVSGIGVDIDLDNVIDVIDRGHDILHSDIDSGLAAVPDGAYDYAILSETLQVVRNPRLVLREMLRVAREGIVSFPNFAKLSHRVRLLMRGRMPKGGALPFEWYDTPNIHLFSLSDFLELCRKEDIGVLDVVCFPGCAVDRFCLNVGLRNLGADSVLVKIARGAGGRGRISG